MEKDVYKRQTSFLVYKLITWAKVTRTGQLVKGLLALVIAYFLADWMQLQTMKYAMQYLFSNGLILLAVIFQPELRTALERVGRSRISKLELFSHQEEKSVDQQWKTAIGAICEAAPVLSRQKTGALMVIERKSRLGEIIKTGTIIDSVPSMELIGNIFFHNSPLHDLSLIHIYQIVHHAAVLIAHGAVSNFSVGHAGKIIGK